MLKKEFGEEKVDEIWAELNVLKAAGKEKTQEYFELMQELNVFSQLVIEADLYKERKKGEFRVQSAWMSKVA